MTTEEKNTALYEKMSAEQNAYREQLQSLPPKEILDHAYEYTVREDIVMAMENAELTDAQTDVLLGTEKPLSAVYNEFSDRETSYMDMIADCIAARANTELRIEQKRREALRKLPVYLYPGDYAREHDEIDQYRESRKANIACRDAIDAAVREYYHENSLDSKAAVTQVVDVFGYDRMLHVCANTIRQKEWDGRISQDSIRWARTLPIYEDKDSFGFDRRIDYLVDKTHPAVFDIFVKAARHEYLLTQPLTPDEIRAEAVNILAKLQDAREPDSPNGTHFIARLSPDFLLRAGDRETAMLNKFLPFKSLALTTFTDRKGVYAVISKDEDRNQKLRSVRPSVLAKLQKPPAKNAPKHSANLRKEAER